MLYSVIRRVSVKSLEFFIYLLEVGDLECYNWHHNQTGCQVPQNTYQSRISTKKKIVQTENSQLTLRTKIGFQTTSAVYSVNSYIKMCLFAPDGLKPKLSILQHRSLVYEVQYQVKSSHSFCGWKYYSYRCILPKEQNESSYVQHERTTVIRLHSFQVKKLN